MGNEINFIFQNMESKFFNLFKKFDHGNLTVAFFHFEKEEKKTNIKQNNLTLNPLENRNYQ